jgi:uncharacterized protein (TIGR03663 family)
MAQGMDWLIGSRQSEEATATTAGSGLTVEAGAYAAVGLLAAALRFFQLGLRPLDVAEAEQALAALRLVGGETQAAPAGTLPALLTGNAISFTLFGAGDAAARLLPALAGVLLALLPLGLRHRLGRGGALVASLLLALSPSAIYASRRVDSGVLVAACGLALAVGLIRYVDFGSRRALYLAAGAAGLGLATGSGFYTLLLILALFGVLAYAGQRWLGRDMGWSSLLEAYEAARLGWGDGRNLAELPAREGEGPARPNLLLRAGAILAAVFGLSATTFVLHPAGIGLAADLLAGWARGFLPEPGGAPAIYPLLLPLLCEPLIVALGLLEAGRCLAARRALPDSESLPQTSLSHSALFLCWAIVAILLAVVAGHRPATGVLLAIVPLALLGGQGVEQVWRWIQARAPRREAGLATLVVLGFAVFLYLQLAAFARASSSATISVLGMTVYETFTYLLLALVALVLVIGLGVAAWAWRGRQVVVAAAWLGAITLLSLFTVKVAWGANFDPDPRELLVGQSTAPAMHLLVDRLEELSRNRSGDPHTLAVTVDAATGPVVGWYLREFAHLEVVEGLSRPPDTRAAVGRVFPYAGTGCPGAWGART